MRIITVLLFWIFHNTGYVLGCFFLGGECFFVLKVVLSAALPQAERNTSVPCSTRKAKAISGTQIGGPLQAILRTVVN